MTESSVLKIMLLLHYSSFRWSPKLIRISNYAIFISNLYHYAGSMPIFHVFLYPLELCFNEYVECYIHFPLFTSTKHNFSFASALRRCGFYRGCTSEAVCKCLSGKESMILMFFNFCCVSFSNFRNVYRQTVNVNTLICRAALSQILPLFVIILI